MDKLKTHCLLALDVNLAARDGEHLLSFTACKLTTIKLFALQATAEVGTLPSARYGLTVTKVKTGQLEDLGEGYLQCDERTGAGLGFSKAVEAGLVVDIGDVVHITVKKEWGGLRFSANAYLYYSEETFAGNILTDFIEQVSTGR